MAEWKIDTIKAGIGFQAFLFAEVWVNDDGIVSARPVPGKAFIGNNSLTNFATVQRNATSPPVPFTTFCNFTTFTLNRIYSSNDFPFAFNTPLSNQEQCGYETVLPTPGVPYNPFGNPNYGDYINIDYCDDMDKAPVNITIKKKDYSGSVTNLPIAGKSPCVISRKTIEDLDTFAVTEAKITLVALENFEYAELYTQDERMFQVIVTKNGLIEFKGYILPDFSRERFDWPATEIEFRATDALTQLKQVTYPVPLGGTTAGRQSFKDILLYCLAPLNLNLDLSTICNVYATTNKMGLNDDPLAQNKVSPLRFTNDNGTILKSYEVLEYICKQFKAVLVQDGGKWIFFRREELIDGATRMRTYDYKGTFLYAEQFTVNRLIGGAL